MKIDNSKEAAVTNGKWSNPGAKFYDKLINAVYCNNDDIKDGKELKDAVDKDEFGDGRRLLKEAYLIAPIKEIKCGPHGTTPYSRSGCKYPHHVIKNDTLVLSVPGVKAALARLKQQGEYKGDPKKHIDRHIRELELKQYIHEGELYIDDAAVYMEKIDNNFNDIHTLIFKTESSANGKYDPPLEYDKLPEELKNDPVHVWRAQTGIELIHKEPTLEELNRIWNNWQLMNDEQKAISDKKSMELFKMNNEDHYNDLLGQY